MNAQEAKQKIQTIITELEKTTTGTTPTDFNNYKENRNFALALRRFMMEV